MNLKSILTKRTVLTALAVGVVAVLGAFLLFPNSSRENATSRPDHTGHAKEAPTPGAAAVTTNDGTLSSRKITSYRSTMMPGEVSQTPRKDSMGMDMVPIYESEGSMLELSEHARAMASVETVPVERRKLSREIRAVGKVQYNETGARQHHHARRRLRRASVRRLHRRRGEGGRPSRRDLQSRPGRRAAGIADCLGESAQCNLIESVQRKLLRWGLTQEQVDEFVRNKKVQRTLDAFSPIKGTVTEKMVVQKAMVKAGRDALQAREPRIGLGLSRHLRIRTALGAIRADGRDQVGGSSRPDVSRDACGSSARCSTRKRAR